MISLQSYFAGAKKNLNVSDNIFFYEVLGAIAIFQQTALRYLIYHFDILKNTLLLNSFCYHYQAKLCTLWIVSEFRNKDSFLFFFCFFILFDRSENL